MILMHFFYFATPPYMNTYAQFSPAGCIRAFRFLKEEQSKVKEKLLSTFHGVVDVVTLRLKRSGSLTSVYLQLIAS